MKKILISTICLNRKDGLQQNLEALYRGSDISLFDLVLTNQNSQDGTAELMEQWAREKGNIRVFHETENTGFQYPNNRSWRIANKDGYEYLLLLNDDTKPPANFLNILLKPFSDPKMAIVGPTGVCNNLKADFHGTGGKLEFIEGSCALINVERVRPVVGLGALFDKNLEFVYAEDSSLSLEVQEKGLKIAQVGFNLEHARSQTTTHGDPAVRQRCADAQEKNHQYCRKRWGHYLKYRSHNYPIFLRRKHAIGDCILMTPLIETIKKSNPQSPIYIDTKFPDVFQNNPNVARVYQGINHIERALVVDLNLAYENTVHTHIVDAYANEARKVLLGLPEVPHVTKLYPGQKEQEWARNARNSICKPHERLALIHACETQWPNKNWHPDKLSQIATWLVLSGWHVVAIGGGAKYAQVQDCVDMTKKTSILKLAALCGQAQLMVGVDSAPIHVAQAMETPTVGIFGCTSARYIMTNGSPHAFAEAKPEIECAGSRHKVTGSENVPCSTACIDSVTVEDVKAAINRLGL